MNYPPTRPRPRNRRGRSACISLLAGRSSGSYTPGSSQLGDDNSTSSPQRLWSRASPNYALPLPLTPTLNLMLVFECINAFSLAQSCHKLCSGSVNTWVGHFPCTNWSTEYSLCHSDPQLRGSSQSGGFCCEQCVEARTAFYLLLSAPLAPIIVTRHSIYSSREHHSVYMSSIQSTEE